MWPIKWHKCLCPWMTLQFTLAIWHFLTHFLGNVTRINFNMCASIGEHMWPVALSSKVIPQFQSFSVVFVQNFIRLQLACPRHAVPQRWLGFLFLLQCDVFAYTEIESYWLVPRIDLKFTVLVSTILVSNSNVAWLHHWERIPDWNIVHKSQENIGFFKSIVLASTSFTWEAGKNYFGHKGYLNQILITYGT